MKPEIHPAYDWITVTCHCSHTFQTRSTCSARLQELRVEVCSQCHPFYTGKEKQLDTRGRATQFKQRYQIKAKP